MTIVYTKPQTDLQASVIGGRIKAAKVTVANTLGQSTTQAVSQKLFTDTVGDIEAALTAINGV